MAEVCVYTGSISRRYPYHVFDITVKSGLRAFAPTWEIVMGFKNGKLTWKQYESAYEKLMLESMRKYEAQWLELLQSHAKIVVVCYCRDPLYCHRRLLVEYLIEFGAKHGIKVIAGGEL